MTEAPRDEFLVEELDGILVFTINRPAQRNAMTLAVATGLAAAMQRLDETPELSVAIITGNGGSFCAGMDLKRFQLGERPSLPGRGFGGVTEAPPQKPLIAAVEGWALGGGFELALACDLIVASRGARFGLPEVKRGLVARAGGLLRLPQRLPRAIALEMMMTGDPMDAERAASFGLVNDVVDDGGALDAAISLAQRIAKNAPLAVRASKAVAIGARDWPQQEGFALQAEYTDPVFASEDAIEGAAAFTERRAPVWLGR